MPLPVGSWTTQTFPTAKSLNLALYTCDGTADNPNGIAFHAYRPVLFDAYGTAVTIPSRSAGTQTTLSSPGPASTATTRCSVIYDTAGYFGQTADAPGGSGFYQFIPAIAGSAGDGITAGGWTILSHFVPVKGTSTQTSVSADMLKILASTVSTTGTRQATAGTAVHSCPFFLDLVNSGGQTWQPAVTLRDSAGASATNAVNLTDASGETCRFYSIWAAVSSTTIGEATFMTDGTYQWVAPAGVSSVTASCTAAGGGGGGGNQSAGGLFYGGGGGGGGEFAEDTVNVTPTTGYTVIVGTGGAGGAVGTKGGAGGLSQFTGDVASVTAIGGSAGGSASTTADGAGGAGGTGSGALTNYNGGSGGTGTTSGTGGGGGSSAGTGSAGNNATDGAGAPAPVGGGVGGSGGSVAIAVVQSTHLHASGNTVTASFSNPVQAGNTVIVALIYQGNGAGADPTVTLNDGTKLTDREFADDNGLTTAMQVVLYDVYNVTGGQTSVTAHGTGSKNQAIGLQIYEVAGLGTAPTIDQQSSSFSGGHGGNTTVYPPSGTSTPTSTAAPEFWMAVVGGQQTFSFDINNPRSSQHWIMTAESKPSAGGIYSRIISGYQVVTSTGVMNFSASPGFSSGVSAGWIVIGYISSANTTGSTPQTGPGGGGGAGLGPNGDGGSGFDGSVTLNWTSESGSGYGTPQVPAPYSNWTDSTTIGAGSTATVNLNGNTGIRDVLNYLSNPPIFRIATTAGGSAASSTVATILFSGPGAAGGGTSPTVDNYNGWGGTTNTYVIQRNGLYLFHGLVAFGASGTGLRQAAVVINGTAYWGPPSPAASSGNQYSPKTQVFSLQTGDTVKLACRQSSGGNLATSTTDPTRMMLVWLGQEGAPAGNWQPPDTTFRWVSGTLGNQLAALFQQHLGNDLGFLANRPYLLAYQGTAQTSLPQSTFSTVTMDTVAGIVHSDLGDNYSGWNPGSSNNYEAPVNGWYLMAGEFFTAAAGAATGTVIAGMQPSTSGGVTPSVSVDWYQQLLATTTAGVGGGATVFGLQYMLAGEQISPVIDGAVFGGSYATLTGAHNGGQYNSHFSAIWVSELGGV